MTLMALVGATVIDGTGRAPMSDAVVLIEGQRILSVTRSGVSSLPDQAEVIDATGRYVIPGLMDANVHLNAGITPELLLEYEGRYEELIEEAAQVTLKAGVTTVFETAGPLEPLRTVRERINSGKVVGSRMFIAGYMIGYPGMLSPENVPGLADLDQETIARINHHYEQGVGPELWWLTPHKLRLRVREYIERSEIDFVKYAACMHQTPLITFSEAAQRVIVEEAHRVGLLVQAHTMSVESLRMEIEAGADLLTHPNITGSELIPDATLQAIVDKSLPSSALVWTDRCMAWVLENFSGAMRTFWNETFDENNRRLIRAGARLLLTTDGYAYGPRVFEHPYFAEFFTGMPDMPVQLGDSHFLWLEAVTQRGMAPMDVLLNSTRNVAEAYGQANDLGTLEPSKRADLIVLEADPLADVHNYRRIVSVMKDGVFVDRDALPLRRILTNLG